MRSLIALAVALALTPVALALAIEKPHALRAVPVMLDHDDPGRIRVGALTWLGGWQLTSDDRGFGGISSLIVDRGRFIGVGDAGNIIRFRFDGVHISGDPAFILADGPGGSAARKSDRDSESSTRDPATGRIWIGFEGANALWRYAPDLRHAEAHIAPPEMARWPVNTGAEALARLRDGRFLVIAEDAPRADGSTEALLYPSDPTVGGVKPLRFGYMRPPGYAVTDAAQLPDGRILVLHRRFTLMDGVSAKLAILDLAGVRDGETVRGREIATLASPLTVDNMEGVAIEQEPGRIVIWLVSDDNFSALQRTLLLKFALAAKP